MSNWVDAPQNACKNKQNLAWNDVKNQIKTKIKGSQKQKNNNWSHIYMVKYNYKRRTRGQDRPFGYGEWTKKIVAMNDTQQANWYSQTSKD